MAPLIALQSFPFESQRCHWYAYAVGLFVQVPCVEFATLPPFEKLTVGSAVFTGGWAGGGGPWTLPRIAASADRSVTDVTCAPSGRANAAPRFTVSVPVVGLTTTAPPL